METNANFYQMFEPESSTYTYLIADPLTKEAALIDTVIETVDRDLKLVQELGLKLKYVLDTHVHADHITGAGEIRKRTGAQSGVSENANVECVDISLHDGQELFLGQKKISVLATPGHTDSCVSFVFEGRVFTGDALLIRGTGRTDFQQGSSEKLYDSIHKKIFTLSDSTQVYPGHDYRGQTASSVEMEKKFNPRIGMDKNKQDFMKIMSELKLANPKRIHEAVPANLTCGVVNSTVPEISVHKLHENLGKIRVIDVRRPDEFNNELGHIPGAELVTLGPDLVQFLEKGDRGEEMVFVCRSGARSEQATIESLKQGFKKTVNMVGGMIQWNEAKLTTVRT